MANIKKNKMCSAPYYSYLDCPRITVEIWCRNSFNSANCFCSFRLS